MKKNIQLYLELIHSLTKTELKILVALFDIIQARFFDKKDFKINPSCQYLAKKAKCSLKTIKNFNKKFREKEHFQNAIKINRISKSGRQYLNIYEFDQEFVKALFLMKFCGSFFSKNYRQRLLTEYAENERFVMKKLTIKIQKLPHVKAKNYPAITTLFNILLEDKKVLTKKVPSSEKTINFSFKGIEISIQQEKYLIGNHPVPVLRKAVDDHIFYTQRGNRVNNNFAFLYNRTKYHDYTRVKWRSK